MNFKKDYVLFRQLRRTRVHGAPVTRPLLEVFEFLGYWLGAARVDVGKYRYEHSIRRA